jgi:hypothetical protein
LLEQRCKALWLEIPHGRQPGTIADAWTSEAPALMPVSRSFDGIVEYSKRVSPTCLVQLERNRYSVPASFANRSVSLRVYPERIVIVAEGQVLCEHRRIIERSHNRLGQTVYDWRHYLAVVQRKPGALRRQIYAACVNLAAMARLSPICPTPSKACNSIFSNGLAAIGRWWR